MMTLLTRFAAVSALIAAPFLAHGAEKTFREQLVDKMNGCEYSLEVIMNKPESAIPADVLREAKGIVVAHQYRAGFIFGGQGGSAVLVARNPQNGNWGVPVFLDPGGINIGFQAGVKEINTVFLLMSDESVRLAYSGRFDIGADAIAVAGPKAAERERFDLFNSPVLVYSSSGGLFAGASFKTAWLAPFDRANREFYQTTHATPEIVLSTWFRPPPEAESLLQRIRNIEGSRNR